MVCTNLLACDGTVGAPSIAINSNNKVGFYKIGTDQLGLAVGANGKGAEFGNFVVNNIVPNPYGPNTVRYTSSIVIQPLGTAVESTGLYMKMNHSTSQMVYGIYGEIDSSQSHTGGSFTRVTHLGAGDAHYVGHFGANGLGYESASWADGTTGFLADVQIAGLPNSVLFNALWQQTTIPNYGLFVATDSPGHSLTISKLSGSNEGQVQIRITEPSYAYNRFEVYNSGQVNQIALHSTAGVTMQNAPEHRLVASYWNGSASVDRHLVMGHAMDSTSPSSHMYIKIGAYASEQMVCMLSPGQVDLQNSTIVTCGGLTMKAGGANADLQMGSLVNCATIQGGTTNLPVYVNANLVSQFGWDGVNSVGTFGLNVGTAASATAGSATLPSNPLGFMLMVLNGTYVKVPYYTV